MRVGRKVKGLYVQGCTGWGVKAPKIYKEVILEKTALLPRMSFINIFSGKAFFYGIIYRRYFLIHIMTNQCI